MWTSVMRCKVHQKPIATTILTFCCIGFGFGNYFALCDQSVIDISVREISLNDTLLRSALLALEKALAFFKEDYTSINLDGLYGVRICQGSLEQALSDCSRKDFDCPRDLTTKLKALSDEINELGVQVLPYVKQQHNSIYFNHFATLLESPYIIEYIPERLGVSTLEIGDNKHYNHNFGDECFSSLLGSYKMTDRFVPKCTITDKCWEFMTQDGTAGYFITHQLLFFIMAEHTGCINKIEEEFLRKTDNSVRDVEQKLCANIYSEAIMQEEDGEVQTLEQDLFIEQSLLCGILGFENFFSEKWITMIISWQSSNGCYSNNEELNENEDPVSRNESQLEEHGDREQVASKGEAWTRRKLLMEKYMSDGCLSHKTGLAIGVLGTFARFLIRLLYIV